MELVEYYANGDIELRVYQVGAEKRWWIKAGVAMLELDEQQLLQFVTLLAAYMEEGEF